MAPLTNIEIVDAARLLYEEWRRQNARALTEDAALREKFGVTDFEALDPDEGYIFTIRGTRYSSAWTGDDMYYYEDGSSLPENPTSPEDVAALKFASEFADLIDEYYSAVHCAAEALGWDWVDDDEYSGTYYHDGADVHLVVPHWCDDFEDIAFLEDA